MPERDGRRAGVIQGLMVSIRRAIPVTESLQTYGGRDQRNGTDGDLVRF